MSEHTAYVVVDLGYGDAGKGSLVDALTARTGARLNVRFNGGGQRCRFGSAQARMKSRSSSSLIDPLIQSNPRLARCHP